MKNNIILPDGLNPKPFIKAISTQLSANLNKYTITCLANMLAIDYTNRIKNKVDLNIHLDLCISRLSEHLKHKIILEEDFSTVMTLFAIALTKKKINDDIKVHLKQQEETLLLEGIMTAYFSYLSLEEQSKMKDILRLIISNGEARDIINFISNEPKLFYSVVYATYKHSSKTAEIAESVKMHIKTILAQDKIINKSINNLKSVITKLTFGAGLFAAASIAFFTGGLALPALLIPTAAVSIRLTSKVSGKIGDNLIKNSNKFKTSQSNLKAMINSILKTDLIKTPELEQEKYISQKKSLTLEKDSSTTPKTRATQFEQSIQITKKIGRSR